MYTVIIVLAVITAVLLCLVVLIQDSKSGGLASNYASSNAIMGVRKTTDVVEKATWTLAAILVILCVASTYFVNDGASADQKVMQIQAQPSAPVVPSAPAQTTAPTQTTATPATPAAASTAPATSTQPATQK